MQRQGQVTRIRYPDGTSEYFGYNGAEELSWRCGPDGRMTLLGRDALHRVIRVEYPGTPGYPAFAVESQLDVFGRVVQTSDATGTSTFAYDDLNRLTSAAPAVGRGVSYQYLKDPALLRHCLRVTMAGTGSWEFREDGKGRPAEVLNPFGQLTTRRYDLSSRLLRETRANGTAVEYSWTDRDWLGGIRHRLASGEVLDTFDYFYTDAAGVYDPTGHLRREVDAGGRTHAFFYNRHYQLICETHPDFGTKAYTLDAAGNRLATSGGGVTEYAGYDAQNKLLWTNQAGNTPPTPNQLPAYRIYEYDLNGQPAEREHREPGTGVTRDRYDWDGMGKLRRVQCVGASQERYRAEYDGAGDRVRMRLDGIDHVYSYGAGLLHDLAEGVEETVYTPGVSQRRAGGDSFFHEDWIGSTRYLTDVSGMGVRAAYRFDAFGQTTAQAGGALTPFRFAGAHGYQSDAPAGLQLLGARHYDPAVGRFLNPDPIGFAGGLNLYGYTEHNPVNAVDPTGERLVRQPPRGNNRGSRGPHWSGTRASGGAVFGRVTPQQADAHRVQQMQRRWTLQQQHRYRRQIAYGGVARDRALHEIYKRDLRRQMEKPHTTDPKLTALIGDLYRGNARVGCGSTADAIRFERATGLKIQGRKHRQKGWEALLALERWLRAHPPSGIVRTHDRAAAENVVRDLQDALFGK